MNRFLLLFLLIACSHCGMAQVSDAFSDGDFTAQPTWVGDAQQFTVVNGMLQLNSSGSDSSHLSVACNWSAFNNLEWGFYLKMAFAPSSANYNRIYLYADAANTEGPVNGYFLQFGESGSTDAIELFRQTGTAFTSVARGISGSIANGFNGNIRIRRDSVGYWTIEAKSVTDVAYHTEGAGTSATPIANGWFGLKCVYTSSNATKTWLDDVYAGPLIVDTVPPAVSGIIRDSTTVTLDFSEAVDSTTCKQTANYRLLESAPQLQQVMYDPNNPMQVLLTFQPAFNNGQQVHLEVQNIRDRSGNVMHTDTLTLQALIPETALAGDVVINEIMADPAGAPSLPSVEYVEIINRSQKVICTRRWVLDDGSTFSDLTEDTLRPGDIRVYCDKADTALMASFGVVHCKGLNSFPGLNNDGDCIRISDSIGQQIDRVCYSIDSYQSALKSVGGWSLERIDADYTCAANLNWKASNAQAGGTPGSINSIAGHLSETADFDRLYAEISDSLHVRITFSQQVDTVLAAMPTMYTIDDNIGHPLAAAALAPDYQSVELTLSTTIDSGKTYVVEISGNFRACSSATLVHTTCKVAIPVAPLAGDIVINEILFNPIGDESDFVEFYNRSSNVIDVSALRLANTNLLTGMTNDVRSISSVHRGFFPGEYLAITEKKAELLNRYPHADPSAIEETSLPSFNDDEGEVRLLNKSLELLDAFHYTDKLQDPLLNFPEGVSLERINPFSSSGSWHSGASTVGFATPGVQNSQFVSSNDTGSFLSIYPAIFSPDNDGKDDVQMIRTHVDKAGYLADIYIFDREGRLVRRLANHALTATTEDWEWDGLDEEHQHQPTGMYLLVVECMHPEGDVKKAKYALVLARE